MMLETKHHSTTGLLALTVSVFLAGIGIAAPAYGAPGVLDEQRMAQLHAAALETFELRAASLQTLAFEQTDDRKGISTKIEFEGRPWTLVLERRSLRSHDFRVLIQDDHSGQLTPVEVEPARTYRGRLTEWPGSRVRASFRDGALQALVMAPAYENLDEASFAIEPMSEGAMRGTPLAAGGVTVSAPAGLHVVYRSSDVIDDGTLGCGTGERHRLFDFQNAPLQKNDSGDGLGSAAGTGLSVADIALDADFEFFQRNAFIVSDTVADMEGIINAMGLIYEDPSIAITYEITTAIVRTVSGAPYTETNPDNLLNQMRSTWNSFPEASIRRDTAHLFTGKNVDGNVIGIAWVGVICNGSFGYGLSQSHFSTNFNRRVGLTAHEVGHNWNAAHCNGCTSCASCCRIMCSVISSCSGIVTSFGCDATGQIVAHRNSRSCLSNLSSPQPVPFFDDFPSTVLDSAKWSFNDGAVVSSNALNEPSSPFSMALDAIGSGDYQDDELRTNFLLLAGTSNMRASYFTQHRNVSAGDKLIVDYRSSNSEWVELNRIVSDGVDQSAFEFWTHVLPADALHDGFRLRFRSDVQGSTENWYLDDVLVTSECSGSSDCDDLLFCNGVETCGPSGCIAGTPPCPGSLCNDTLDACVACLNDGDCSDGLFCTGIETCDATGQCQPGQDPCVSPDLPFCNESTASCVVCLVGSDCADDGLFCTTAVCVDNQCDHQPGTCEPQACDETANLCVDPAVFSCVASSSTVAPGGNVTVDLFLQDAPDVQRYDTRITITSSLNTNHATVLCPGGITIDQQRPDFIFAGLSQVSAPNCPFLIATGIALSASASVDTIPAYLGTYSLTISPDAIPGEFFRVSMNPAPDSNIRDSFGFNTAFTIAPECIVTVVDCNPCILYGDISPDGGDCVVDLDDVLCGLAGFADANDCPGADLFPCGGDGAVDVDDILALLSAFSDVFLCPHPCR